MHFNSVFHLQYTMLLDFCYSAIAHSMHGGTEKVGHTCVTFHTYMYVPQFSAPPCIYHR